MVRLVPEIGRHDQLMRSSQEGRELQQPEQGRQGKAVKGRNMTRPTRPRRHRADAAEPTNPQHQDVGRRKTPTHLSRGLSSQGQHHQRQEGGVKGGGSHANTQVEEQGQTAEAAQARKIPAVNAEGLHVPLDPAAALASPC